MKTRVIAAAVLLPLLLVVVLVLPNVFMTVLVGIVAAVAAYELLWGTGLVKNPRLVAYSALMALLTALWSGYGKSYPVALISVLLFTLVLGTEMLIANLKLRFEKVMICVAGGLLIPFLLSALVRLHSGDNGRAVVMIPFVLAFLSDSGAYFVGCAFGKHKLAPQISPKKSVEGVIGGVLGAVIGALIYCLVLDLAFGFYVNYFYALIYGLLGSLASVVGDLIFSVIKRQTGIKDYGNLIPGHGGALDRFDSMTLVAPLVEALMLLIPLVER